MTFLVDLPFDNSVGVDARYTEHEDRSDDQDEIKTGETNENTVDGALHLRSGENDDRDEIAKESENTDCVEKNSGDTKVENWIISDAGQAFQTLQ